MKNLRTLAAVCAAILMWAIPNHAADTYSPAFEKLKTLVGNWEGKMEDGQISRVSYRLTSSGSVLVETDMPGEPMEMLTLYHPDGDSVIATHYCDAKNQPRMRASGGSGEIREIKFNFLDITNLASPSTGYMRDLVITFQDDDHFTARWTYRENGKDSPYVFTYTRKK
ncbi:MAG: hypothetical protein ABSG54_14585 [Terriglobia bacterium]|jgi:hypothetical protein